jgi:phosphoenolpyruvate---glycerone phosphotransferase subunit DhaL
MLVKERTVKLNKRNTKELIEAIARTVIAKADELTELDRVIGDADHGANLERGFQAVLKNIEDISALPIGASLNEVGRTLVMAVGGASGPLFGTLFMATGKSLGEDENLTRERLLAAFDEAVKAVKARGKSEAGQKTMLDVLVPVLTELHVNGPGALRRAHERALLAAQATVPMVAQRGRASFLGERSAGHMDPGARSSQLIISAACSFIEEQL